MDKIQQFIQPVTKEATLQDGSTVIIQVDTISIPQPDQKINKDQLVQDTTFLTFQIQSLQDQLDKKNELLALL